MDNEELIKQIEELKKQNQALVSANANLLSTIEESNKKNNELEIELQKAMEKNRQLSVELNQVLLKLAAITEKDKIMQARMFVPKTETQDSILINETEDIIKKEKKTKTNKGKKYKTKTAVYENLPCKEKHIYPDETNCPTCGTPLVEISPKIRYEVEVIPAKIKLIKVIKHTFKCPKCNKLDNKLYYPVTNTDLEGSILTPSLAAFIAYNKYELGIPFNHLESYISSQIGLDISKQSLANYMAKCANLLEPIYKQMRLDLLNNQSHIIHSDETTLVVSKQEDKDRKKSYVYAYTSSFYDSNQIRIYDFHESRSPDKTAKWLKDFSGIIVCDDYAGYTKIKKDNPNIKLQRCWVHVRRKFSDIIKGLPREDAKKTIPIKIIKLIDEMFKFESIYKKKHLLKYQIEQRRKIDITPIKQKLDNILFTADPMYNGALNSALKYFKSCYEDLYTFMDNGYCEISNNTCERAIKPFVIQRKVFQTACSYAGARYTTILFSIIQTCKINNVDPKKYLEFVLSNLDKPVSSLTPYNIKL